MLLHFCGINFEDRRVNCAEFDQIKQSGDLPFCQLPVLRIQGGQILAQTNSISRYIAQMHTGRHQERYYTGLHDPELDCRIEVLLEYSDTFLTSCPFFAIESLDYNMSNETIEKHLSTLWPDCCNFLIKVYRTRKASAI